MEEQETQEQETQEQETQEPEGQGSGGEFFSPGWIMITALNCINEIIDIIGLFANITGVWAIIIFILNLITLFFNLGYRALKVGFSFSAMFGTGWQAFLLVANLILEHIPVVGDIWPGWLINSLAMLGIKVKKTPGVPVKTPKVPAPKP